jgi:rubrerythrin
MKKRDQETLQMDMENLQTHIRALAMLPATDDPVVSCFVALENRRLKAPNLFDEQIRAVRTGLAGETRRALEEALQPVQAFLHHGLSSDAKGAAIFSRAGKEPFLMTIQCRVPLPNWTVVDRTPNIYHLVELKDTYEQYVVMLATKESVRIIEMNLGAVTRHLSAEMPELRQGTGRKCSKEHYQKHLNERGHRFVKEQIRILEQVMAAREHTHLILAGHPAMTARVRGELPPGLLSRLVDVVRASDAGVVAATIDAFIKAEEKESQTIAEKLVQQVRSGGLAVAGTAASFEALQRNQADMLVLLKTYAPGEIWVCQACGFMDPEAGRLAACPECGSGELACVDAKEQMVRFAERQLCAVEVVNESESLERMGGVGCLLRYRLAHEYRCERASIPVSTAT